MEKKMTIEKISARWGVLTFLGLSAYFLLMKLIGLEHNLQLRALNAVIMFLGTYQAIRMAKEKLDEFNYFKGIGTGILTAGISAAIFSIFGILYLQLIDPSFMADIKQNEPLGLYQNAFIAPLQIFIEGTFSGSIMSFVIMQWLKKPWIKTTEIQSFNSGN